MREGKIRASSSQNKAPVCLQLLLEMPVHR